MEWWALIADAADAVKTITGEGAGWVGTTLLSAVLYWLLNHHLPGKDKQIKELLDRHDAVRRADQDVYRASLKEITDHCRDENERIAATFKEEIGRVIEAVERAANHIPPSKTGRFRIQRDDEGGGQ